MTPPPTLMALLQTSATWLTGKGISNARRECDWLFQAATGLSRLELYTHFDMPLDPAQVDRLRDLVRRRGKREPLAYLIGTQPFADLELTVTPAVLVPRPETEELIPLAAADLPQGGRAVDIGTGSGAIALALAKARPDARIEATDVSPEALAVAQGNAERLGLTTVTFHQGDLGSRLSGPYDLIVANLPYIAEDERGLCDPELAHEPALALFSGRDGLDAIRRLVADAPRLLAPTGVLWLEHGFRQASAISALLSAVGLTTRTTQDSAALDRFTRGSR